jgi:hypothetical protein
MVLSGNFCGRPTSHPSILLALETQPWPHASSVREYPAASQNGVPAVVFYLSFYQRYYQRHYQNISWPSLMDCCKAIKIHFWFCRGEKGFDDGSQRAIEYLEGTICVRNVCIMTCFDTYRMPGLISFVLYCAGGLVCKAPTAKARSGCCLL